jgi:hypothetical protein
MLRLFNDHHETGMSNLSAETRLATVSIANIIKNEVAQDSALVWC